jgi:hypothetical protein
MRGGWAVLVVLIVAGAAAGQAPDAPDAPPAPAATAPPADLTTEPLDDATATEAPATATRRPRWTSTAPALSTEAPTAAPTDTATQAPSHTRAASHTATQVATATAPPTATATVPRGLFGPESPGVDPLTLLAGGGLALLAVWFGARLAGARERRERRRARQTLATAMLLELRRIDAVLRRMVALDNPASFPSLDHPIMEAALRDLTLFATQTAARIAQFHGALRGIQHEISDYRDNPLRWAGRLGELNQLIKGRAAATCRAVPELSKALGMEGGAPPSPVSSDGGQSGGGIPPELPPRPFAGGDPDDWTM